MSLFDIANLKIKLEELENKTKNPEFWNDNKQSTIVLKEINNIKSKTEMYQKNESFLNDIIEMNELVELEKEESLEIELQNSIRKLQKDIEKLEINILLSGKYDSNNAIITIHPGARRNRKL